MSRRVSDEIRGAASRNAELLGILRETDHAPSELEQQNRYLNDITSELTAVEKRRVQLDRDRQKELKEHEKYRDSVMRRFVYRVGGKTDKFQARAEKEEKEYFDVLQKLQQHNDQKANLQNMIEEAKQVKANLISQTERHKQAQADLDGLYQSIFQGETPEFPQEDSLERAADAAGQAYHQANMQSDSDKKVVNMLSGAFKNLQDAMGHIEDALSASRYDMFGGGSMADMMERNALSKAQNSIHMSQMLALQAQHLSPHVQNLPEVGINHGSIMSDVFFDNIFTDMAFHEKIKDSRAQLQNTMQACEQQVMAAKERQNVSSREMQSKWNALLQARSQLQKAREQIFENVVSGNSAKPLPEAPLPPVPGKAGGSNNPFDQPPAYGS